MKNKFGDMLKKLIQFTNIKLNVIAYHIGYDISYISKWANNTSQPTKKHIERINDTLSSIFAEEIIHKDYAYLFLKEFNIHEPLPTKDIQRFLHTQINNLLNNAYYCSHENFSHSQSNNDIILNSTTIVGRTNIYEFFCHKLAPIINKITPKLEIFITMDILTLLQQKKFFSFLDCCNLTDRQIDIHIGCNLSTLANSDEKLIYSLYKFLNKYFYVNFYIYEDKFFNNSNIFLVKNAFAIQYSLHLDKSIDICTFINNEKIINEIQKRISDTFFNSPIILQPKKEIILNSFHPFFYLNKNFTIFITNGFEFFLPKKSYLKMIDLCKQQNLTDETIASLKNLQIMWEEQFEKNPISFILPELNLMDYIQKGKLIFGDLKYQTTPQEREEQLSYLIQSMYKNPLIDIYLMSQQENVNDINYYKLSYYSNQKIAYFKKNKYLLNKYHLPIYFLKNSLLIQKFDMLFSKFKQTNFVHKYTAEKIENLYLANKSLLHRIMENK